MRRWEYESSWADVPRSDTEPLPWSRIPAYAPEARQDRRSVIVTALRLLAVWVPAAFVYGVVLGWLMGLVVQ